MNFFPLDIFFAILITMGPLKVVLVYGETTRHLSPELRRKIAIKAVVVAAIVGLLFIVLGKFLLDLFHFSIAALTIAGGVILFIFRRQHGPVKWGERRSRRRRQGPVQASRLPISYALDGHANRHCVSDHFVSNLRPGRRHLDHHRVDVAACYAD